MPTVTRQTGAPADKEAEEQAKVNAANAKIVKMNQVKTKMSNLQTKPECSVGLSWITGIPKMMEM